MIVAFYRTLAALLCGLLLSPGFAQELQLRVMLTTDVHMHLLDYDYGQDQGTPLYGLARTASLIEQARIEVPNHLLFDNGDLLQGSPLGAWLAGPGKWPVAQLHPAYRALQALKVDAANLGNHEFDFGLPFLKRALAGVPFPVLSANVLDARTTRPVFSPATMLHREWRDSEGQVQRVRVGVVGLAPPRSIALLREQLQGRVRTIDAVEAARHWVGSLREQGADLVLLLAHTGLEAPEQAARPMDDNVALALAQIPGVDALLLGHAHSMFPATDAAERPSVDFLRGRIHGVPAVMPGRWGDHLGLIDLTLQRRQGRWHVQSANSQLRPVWDAVKHEPLVEPAHWMQDLIANEHAATREWVQQPITTSAAPLHTHFAQVLDSAALQLLNEAQLEELNLRLRGTRWATLPRLSAASPFRTTGIHGRAVDIPAGSLALKHAVDLYPYQNRFSALQINGAQLREWLEMVAGQYRTIKADGPAEQALLDTSYPSYNFDVIDGVEYTFDLTQAPRYSAHGQLQRGGGRRVARLTYQGRPVHADQQFIIATNSYRAAGGGRFAALEGAIRVLDGPLESREVLLRHLRRKASFSVQPDQNWQIQPLTGVRMVFPGLAQARIHLPATPQVEALDPEDTSGLQRFALRMR